MPQVAPSLWLQARQVWPVSRPPFDHGAVLVIGDTLAAVGTVTEVPPPAGARRMDLGEVLLLPGLVNAHCHLDYTHMAGQLTPGNSFTDWIKSITALKAEWTRETFYQSWVAGAAMLVRRGVTLVGDIEAVQELLPAAWDTTPLRVMSFLEMTGVKSRRDPALIVGEAVARGTALPTGRCRVGLSPHAPYSTVPELLRLSAAAARSRGWRLSTHVAESAEEFEMFAHRRGPLFEWLLRNGRDPADCGGLSPVQHLARTGLLGPDLVAVHANYLADGDAALLARFGVSVVHCPRSHAYFGHRPFPWAGLSGAGVRVCLGTDSLASVSRSSELVLDLFAEMRSFLAHHPGVSPETVVRMATCEGARALGCESRAGTLQTGAWADVIAIPWSGTLSEVPEAVVHHAGEVRASLIGGRWAMPSPEESAA